jgi:hypothetical protein
MGIPEIWGQRYRAGLGNAADAPYKRCALCGRPVPRRGKGYLLRLDEGISTPIPIEDPTPIDGGFFPVGSECKTEFPAEYVTQA